jgi:hypothetical protein
MSSIDNRLRLLGGQVRIFKLIARDNPVEDTLAALTAWWRSLSWVQLPALRSSTVPNPH